MKYTFSNRLKIGSFIAMGLGLLMLAYGFISTPSTPEEAVAMVAAAHDDGQSGVPREHRYGRIRGHSCDRGHDGVHVRVHGSVEPGLAAWDLAASHLLVEEAGGQVTGLAGEAGFRSGGAILSNGLLHAEALAVVARHQF